MAELNQHLTRIVQQNICSSQSIDLSLQAIDFLFASSIHDGWLLSDEGGKARGTAGEGAFDGDDNTFFRKYLSSQDLSGTLMGLDSEGKKTCHVAQWDTVATVALQ